MRKSTKKGLWRGIASLTCFTLSLSLILGNVLEANAGTIDTYLGTASEVFVSDNTEENPLYDKFTPPAELLNEDGTGNSTALIEAAMDLNRREAAEGAVLLKNNTEDGQGLPLSSGSNVTLLGIRSHVSLMGSSFGVKAQGPYISLEQALSQNRTDFANTINTTQNTNATSREVATSVTKTMESWTGEEFDFEGAGFNINPTMVEIYDKLNETYNHATNENPEEVYNPGEPSISEIEAVNAGYKDSFADYSDAAIVVISRPSAESKDYLPGGIAEGLGAEEPLALTTNERDAIELAKEASDNVIVLVNTATAVEIGDLKNDPEIDAILWIGFPGCYGMLGVADILCGRTSPSGGLFDIFPTYNMSAPAMQNMGKMYYTNTAEEITRTGGVLGFTPGFTYLGGMSDEIATPRLKQPRVKIPAGSVGIAGSQTGVYPIDSPGGWQLIGKTPVRMYDPDRAEPILPKAGEYIKFYSITQAEFDAIAAQEAAGTYECKRHPRKEGGQ